MNKVLVVRSSGCCTFLGLKTHNRRMESFILVNLFLLQNSLHVLKKLKSDLCKALSKRYTYYLINVTRIISFLYITSNSVVEGRARHFSLTWDQNSLVNGTVVPCCLLVNVVPLYLYINCKSLP